MTEPTNELILEGLRPIQADIADFHIGKTHFEIADAPSDLADIGLVRLAELDVRMAELSVRMDRRDEQMERILRRLERAEHPQ